MYRRVRGLVIAAVIALVFACTLTPEIDSAGDLASALRREGIAFTSQEPAPQPAGSHFRFDEGISLKGEDLWIDILTISDQRTFAIAEGAAGLLTAAEDYVGKELPGEPDVYTRHPFVVIVRQQPKGSDVFATLLRLLPPLEA